MAINYRVGTKLKILRLATMYGAMDHYIGHKHGKKALSMWKLSLRNFGLRGQWITN